MRLKIYSEGTPNTTHVFNEDGEELEGVTSVFWALNTEDKKSVCMIVVEDVEADVSVDDRDLVSPDEYEVRSRPVSNRFPRRSFSVPTERPSNKKRRRPFYDE